VLAVEQNTNWVAENVCFGWPAHTIQYTERDEFASGEQQEGSYQHRVRVFLRRIHARHISPRRTMVEGRYTSIDACADTVDGLHAVISSESQ
jgi:hypothetical protein